MNKYCLLYISHYLAKHLFNKKRIFTEFNNIHIIQVTYMYVIYLQCVYIYHGDMKISLDCILCHSALCLPEKKSSALLAVIPLEVCCCFLILIPIFIYMN